MLTYTQIGEHQRAQGYCEDAININPNYAEAWRALGQAEYPQRNYEGAIDSFEHCLALESSRPVADQDIECYYLRGLAHYYLGDCQQAWDILTDRSTASGRRRMIPTTRCWSTRRTVCN